MQLLGWRVCLSNEGGSVMYRVDPMRPGWEIEERSSFGRLCRRRRCGIYGGSLGGVSEGVANGSGRMHTL
jgi:hypothetical protein